MSVVKKGLSSQPFLFVFGLTLFLIAAVLGWEKLHYGFSVLDEGCFMTESWRLTVGDHFLKDAFISSNTLYSLISSLVFEIRPGITLLGFRKLQYFSAIFSLSLISFVLFKVDKQYWYQPVIFSLFAFTGLDPIGMISNLTYYTYPHLFLTLYMSFFILGLYQKGKSTKQIMYMASGLSLWGISLSILHLSVVIISPILLFLVARKLRLKSFSFGFSDLCLVLAPFVFCWAVFIGIYNKDYILAVYRAIGSSLSVPGYTPDTLVDINWGALSHIGISLLFLLICLYGLKKLRLSVFIIGLVAISIFYFFVIDTSFFGLLTPYYHGWFSRPMWFCSLLISFFILFLFNIVKKHYYNERYSRGEELAIVLLIPCTILSLCSSMFSSLGLLTILHCSIPVTAAAASVVLYHKNIQMKSYTIKFFIFVIFLFPFYYTTAWSDWKFTFFDVPPEQANVRIEQGFGKGINTNRIYYNLYEWIRMNTEKYAEKDDFMISYIASPMVHMISKLRPALASSRISLSFVAPDFLEKSIEKMKKSGRHPKIAFVFEYRAAFYPISLKEKKYRWFSRGFVFSEKDPISRYILENMQLVGEHKIFKENIVKCFLDSKMIKKKALHATEDLT